MSIGSKASSLCAAALLVTLAGHSVAQTPAAVAPAPASGAGRGQTVATVNAPIQLLGVPVNVTAPAPVSYIGSAYQDDVSGQSESNADPAIAESARNASPDLPDAW